MKKFYSNEKQVQILITLLKANNIKKVIASPGATNVAFIGSIQGDPFFEIYSAVDERSAAYIACGLSSESGEPVVISCTGATSSRNYLPGLTEAYYRKLPILAVTSTQIVSKVGHLVAQVIDRSNKPNDVATLSVTLPVVKDADDFWDCEVKVNQAILALKRRGGGPVHINLPTVYDRDFGIQELPKIRVINRISYGDSTPEIIGKVAIFIGAHKKWSDEETKAIDSFCAKNDAVVFCDHNSAYKGKYRVQFALAASQQFFNNDHFKPDLFIHLGEVSGDYPTLGMCGKNVWRVSEDGEIRDAFRRLTHVFEMKELDFFNIYNQNCESSKANYLNTCKSRLNELREKIPEVPFSNIWLASKIAHRIPENSTIHFGILNSLRSWNYYELPSSVSSAVNTGGFGIDGALSTILGASLSNREKLFFLVLGDLAFFYDMNALGNRHIGCNLRILLVNNGKGTEFTNYDHHAARFGEDAENFMAATGHYGNRSRTLVKNYVESLGFEYISAQNKEQFENTYTHFISPTITERSIIFEVFTDSTDESKALELMKTLESESSTGLVKIRSKFISAIRSAIGDDKVDAIKKMVKL